jgi:hypothetical protein
MDIQDATAGPQSQQSVRYGVEESENPLFTGLDRLAGAQLPPQEVEMMSQGRPVDGTRDETVGSGFEGTRDGLAITVFRHHQDAPARFFGKAPERRTQGEAVHLRPGGSQNGEVRRDFLDALEDFGSIPNFDDIGA